MAWSDEKRAEVIAAYEQAEPTALNSMEIVTRLAEEFEESVNGTRMILSKAGVYVKKEAATKSTSTTGTASTRVSKADAQAALSAALTDAGQEVDEDIVSKLTGKAAQYLAGVVTALNA
jgi:hypothetical protein